jgi:hypothetical protein
MDSARRAALVNNFNHRNAHTEGVERSCPEAYSTSEVRERSIISLSAALAPIDNKPVSSGADEQPRFLWETLECPITSLPPGLTTLDRKVTPTSTTYDLSNVSSPERSDPPAAAESGFSGGRGTGAVPHAEGVDWRSSDPAEVREYYPTIAYPPPGLGPPLASKPSLTCSPARTCCSSQGLSPDSSESSDANEASFTSEAEMCPIISLPPGLTKIDTLPNPLFRAISQTSSVTSTYIRSDCSSPETRSETSEAREDSGSDAVAPAFQIAELVLRECAFLRTRGYQVRPENRPTLRNQGVTDCIVVYVVGLPASKRTKWMVPLFNGVAAVLNKVGCRAKVLHGVLLVALDEEDAMVRLDMVATF